MKAQKGTKFIDSNGITHTIIEIDENKVIHEYKQGRRIIKDGFIYRSVFDRLINNGNIWVL